MQLYPLSLISTSILILLFLTSSTSAHPHPLHPRTKRADTFLHHFTSHILHSHSIDVSDSSANPIDKIPSLSGPDSNPELGLKARSSELDSGWPSFPVSKVDEHRMFEDVEGNDWTENAREFVTLQRVRRCEVLGWGICPKR